MLDLAPARRLAGVHFESEAPPGVGDLPRMDVAVLAGFARQGPVELPVAVEDPREFAQIFGDDLPLCWDRARGRPVYAHLAPAVRLFFANGGRRCHVVRLAADPVTNLFPVPGLLSHGGLGPTQALVAAGSPGSWSDGLGAGASLDVRRLTVTAFELATLRLGLRLPAGERLVPGDLLRLAWRAGDGRENLALYLRVASVAASAAAAGGSPPVTSAGTAVTVVGDQPQWLEPVTPAGSSSPPVVVAGDVRSLVPGHGLAAHLLPPAIDGGGRDGLLRLDLAVTDGRPPAAGELLIVGSGDQPQLILAVREIVAPEPGRIAVAGIGFRRSPADLSAAATLPATAERLRLQLWARRGGQEATRRLKEIGLAPGHPRHLRTLPDDTTVHSATAAGRDGGAELEPWADARATRFPFAGTGPGEALFLPIDVPTLPPPSDAFLGPLPDSRDALTRDGLATFGPGLFADPDLAWSFSTSLLQDAEHLRAIPRRRPTGAGRGDQLAPYRPADPDPSRLRGLHAALPVEEASLIAVPDAVHRGWGPAKEERMEPPEPPSAPGAAAGPFGPCRETLVAPALRLAVAQDTQGRFGLAWDETLPDGTGIELEEARSPLWDDAGPLPVAAGASMLELRRAGPALFYYRARLARGRERGPWSAGVAVRIGGAAAWEQLGPKDYRDTTLLAVHRLLLRLAAARGDMVAVLSLPGHLREVGALAHAGQLRRPPRPADASPSGGDDRDGIAVPPLGQGEAGCLSHGALYHPWPIAAGEDPAVAAGPPDGAVCGVAARRALARGAWVAPANEPLRGIVALDPPIPPEHRQDLLDGQVNLLRQETRGPMALSADTLSIDPDTRPLNVRRLLTLLRRLALREGQAYAFEPDDDGLRRAVERDFDAYLGEMFRRGAFAGRTAAEGFRVSTGRGTPAGLLAAEAGRLVVELRVAPSRPLAFLLLRLLQVGERLAVQEG